MCLLFVVMFSSFTCFGGGIFREILRKVIYGARLSIPPDRFVDLVYTQTNDLGGGSGGQGVRGQKVKRWTLRLRKYCLVDRGNLPC